MRKNNAFLIILFVFSAIYAASTFAATWQSVAGDTGSAGKWTKIDCESGSGWRKCVPQVDPNVCTPVAWSTNNSLTMRHRTYYTTSYDRSTMFFTIGGTQYNLPTKNYSPVVPKSGLIKVTDAAVQVTVSGKTYFGNTLYSNYPYSSSIDQNIYTICWKPAP